MRKSGTRRIRGCGVALALLLAGAAGAEEGAQKTTVRARLFHSNHLEADVLVLPGVFFPNEAERMVLPFMKENAARFDGASVFEIGTGTGMISLYAAKLGAKSVVATDISEHALVNARENAKRLGFSGVVETRLVPPTDISAYSVIGPDERFDVISVCSRRRTSMPTPSASTARRTRWTRSR